MEQSTCELICFSEVDKCIPVSFPRSLSSSLFLCHSFSILLSFTLTPPLFLLHFSLSPSILFLIQGPVKLKETFSLSALNLEYQLAQGKPELQEQIKKKLQTVQQMLQTKRNFPPYYKKGVEASIARETKLYQQFSKAGRQEEAKVLMERVKAMQTEFKKL